MPCTNDHVIAKMRVCECLFGFNDNMRVDNMRAYLSQLRQEMTVRLIERIYSPAYLDTENGRRPSKWWMSFQKRKFMNKSL